MIPPSAVVAAYTDLPDDPEDAPVGTVAERVPHCHEPLNLTVMRVAGMFGIHPPDLLQWHAVVDHFADPRHPKYLVTLDEAARCFTDDRQARRYHLVRSIVVTVAAMRRRPLGGQR